MIRILVVDDHTLVREGLCRLLDSEANFEVVAQTGSGRDAVRLCEKLKPNVVILDYKLPDIDGLETTEQIVQLKTGARILILTMYANEEYAIRVIRAGAAGFLVKGASTDELLKAVRKVVGKGTYVSPAILEKMTERMTLPLEETPESVLSNREMQVLVQLSRGATSREVAEDLCLSLSTVETYRSRILEKLNLRNNSDITRFAIRRGLIDLG
ncbi:MAG: response regulator transcription factor [Deltaproteobacteria bacterium]|nr:response regulator transcription factor [Deltaproteobacteria bacterium]